MKAFQLFPIALVLLCSCTGSNRNDDVDLQYVRDLGYEYARNYRTITGKSREMEREHFLLDVKSREHQLRCKVSDAHATEFIKAFADSAFTALP